MFYFAKSIKTTQEIRMCPWTTGALERGFGKGVPTVFTRLENTARIVSRIHCNLSINKAIVAVF